LGYIANNRAHLAADFYQAVTGTTDSDPRLADVTVTGHSLGGGLAWAAPCGTGLISR
jgi:hypothetical protein